jgi:fused signal recognition particle receptor
MFDFFKKDKTPNPAPEPAQDKPAELKQSWTERLKNGLAKTRSQLGSQLTGLFSGGKIDDTVYEELETILLSSDVGVAATQTLLEEIRTRVKRQNLNDTGQLRDSLKQAMLELLAPLEQSLETSTAKPFVIMLVANLLQAQGKSVLIAAGDTFRAAAREQLQAWGERNKVHVVTNEGGDSAAVIFDAVNSAKAKGIDIVLADTAGRLPTQLNLMEEIRKVQRVISKALPGAPHEVLLVLDANTGQNAVSQVQAFDDALKVTGLVLTKLDGTAKGGVIAAIAQSRAVPVRYIGVGESIDDLRPFKSDEFVEALFE